MSPAGVITSSWVHAVGRCEARKATAAATSPGSIASCTGRLAMRLRSVRMIPSATSSATWTPAGRSSWASDCVNARAANWAAAHGPRPGMPRRAEPPEIWTSVPDPRRASAAPPPRRIAHAAGR